LIASTMLESIGVNVTVAENGKLALDAINKTKYDLILMDIQMPDMDGISACRIIRQSNNEVPIVALTANVMSDDVANYKEEGFNDHRGKLLDLKDVIRVLAAYLSSVPCVNYSSQPDLLKKRVRHSA